MSIRRLTTAVGALLMAVAATTALSVGSAQAGTCKNIVKVVVQNGFYWGMDANGRVQYCGRRGQ